MDWNGEHVAWLHAHRIHHTLISFFCETMQDCAQNVHCFGINPIATISTTALILKSSGIIEIVGHSSWHQCHICIIERHQVHWTSLINPIFVRIVWLSSQPNCVKVFQVLVWLLFLLCIYLLLLTFYYREETQPISSLVVFASIVKH